METSLHSIVSQALSPLLSPTSPTPLLSCPHLHYYEVSQPRSLSISVSPLFPDSFHLLNQAEPILLHPNLIRAEQYQEVETEEGSFLISVMEEAGMLLYRDMEVRKERKRPYLDEEMRRLVGQIASALQYMKERKLAHGSVSPFSIFFKQNRAVLGNFCTLQTTTSSNSLTKGYESIQTSPASSQFDIHSLGMTALQMLLVTNGGVYRTDPLNEREIKQFLADFQISTSLREILSGMLDFDPQARLLSEEVLFRLNQSSKSLIFVTISSHTSADSSNFPCDICGGEYATPLPGCRHEICTKCVQQMGKKKRKCPLCVGISTKSCPLCPLL